MPGKISFETVVQRVKEVQSDLEIDESTFVSYSRKCRFVDPELGEFWTKPVWLVSQRSGHPARSADKAKKTNMERYGASHHMKTDRYRETFREKGYFQKFVDSGNDAITQRRQDPEFRKKVSRKIEQTVLERYGDFKVRGAANRERTKYFIGDETLGEYCRRTGVPYSTIQGTIVETGCTAQECVDSWESGSSKLELFCERQFGWGRLDQKIGIGGYRPDFCVAPDVFVDVDGLVWHSEKYRERAYHFEKRAAYENSGKRIFQFYASEIRKSAHIVRSIVQNKLDSSPNRFFARKCLVSEMRNPSFFSSNHLMGERKGASHIFLVNEGSIVFGVSYTVHGSVMELQRVATLVDSTVIGGLSKILSFLLNKFPAVKKIRSWVDLRYGTGEGLKAVGFREEKTIISWRWTDGYDTFNRMACKASEGRSENENAALRNWVRIYDAGQRLMVKDV